MVLFLLLAAVFLILNRAAYQGYFQDDELDNLSWAPLLPAGEYLKIALAPRFQPNNFRPVGHFYFHAAEGLFDLEFPGYVATIHALHRSRRCAGHGTSWPGDRRPSGARYCRSALFVYVCACSTA